MKNTFITLLICSFIIGLTKEANAQLSFKKTFDSSELVTPKQTSIIPNPYKSKRGGHRTPAAAVFQKSRMAGIELEKFDGKEKSDGTIDEEQDSFSYQPFFYVSDGKFSFEARIYKANDDVDDSTAVAKNKAQLIEVQAALSMSKDLAAGLKLSEWEYEFDGVTKIEQKVKAISFVRKLDDVTYFGGELRITDSDAPVLGDNAQTLSVGMGKVFGDPSRPEKAGEAILSYANELGQRWVQFQAIALKNVSSTEYSANLYLLSIRGDGANTEVYYADAGADMPFRNFYLAPKVSLAYVDTLNSHTKTWGLEAELGKRVEEKEYFLKLRMENSKGNTTGSGSEDEKDKDVAILVGFNTSL